MKFKYNGPNIMIGQYFCSPYIYKARNRICVYIKIRALLIMVLIFPSNKLFTPEAAMSKGVSDSEECCMYMN